MGKVPWRRAWQPTPVFFPGESRGQRGLAGYSPWGYKESDVTEETVYILKRIPEKIKNLKNIKLERKEFERLIDIDCTEF